MLYEDWLVRLFYLIQLMGLNAASLSFLLSSLMHFIIETCSYIPGSMQDPKMPAVALNRTTPDMLDCRTTTLLQTSKFFGLLQLSQ